MVGNKKIGQCIYEIYRLSDKNVGEVQRLCESCSDFSELIEGRPPEKDAGQRIRSDLPPGKEQKDKYVFGVYKESNSLIAVIDIIKDYKVEGEWVVGLLMIDPSERGKGLGSNLHKLIKEWVRKEKGVKLTLGVVEDNRVGYRFWEKIGYMETHRVKSVFGDKEHTVIGMGLLLMKE